MSKSHSNKKLAKAEPTPRKLKALPPVGIAVAGTVCKILRAENQPAHAALLSFTADAKGGCNFYIGMLRRADIIGSPTHSRIIPDEQSQARLESLKVGDTLTVKTMKASFNRQGNPLIDLSERAVLESIEELLGGTQLLGTVCSRQGECLTIDLGDGIKGRLHKSRLAPTARFEDFVPNQSLSVHILGFEIDPAQVGQFYLNLGEVQPDSLAA
jgi:hypothetical protein